MNIPIKVRPCINCGQAFETGEPYAVSMLGPHHITCPVAVDWEPPDMSYEELKRRLDRLIPPGRTQ